MSDLQSVLNRLARPRIAVLGDLMLDRYTWGNVDRVSPEAPVPILHSDLEEVRPGGAACVAALLRGLEAEVLLAGVVGDDSDGRTLRRILDDAAVNTTGVHTVQDRPTTSKHRLVGRAGSRHPHQILRVDREDASPIHMDVSAVLQRKLQESLPDCAALLVSDYGKGACRPELLKWAIDTGRRWGIPTLVDPFQGADYRRYRGATLLTPNRRAAAAAVGRELRTEVDVLNAADLLRQQAEAAAVVITLDREGIALSTAEHRRVIPTRPRNVYDVTGAGDMVLAVLGLCAASHVPLFSSAELANVAAGLEVERFGIEPVSRTELSVELGGRAVPGNKVVATGQIVALVAARRRLGQSVVFTNGCFDLLHVGHVSMLQEAAGHGDCLVVAINSDASVRRLKGADRPTIPEADRARLLAALACVDFVLIFDDDTPHELLREIRPDVLVKGGTTRQVIGREIVEAYGGRIIVTQAVPGLSTTQLLQRAHSRPHTAARGMT